MHRDFALYFYAFLFCAYSNAIDPCNYYIEYLVGDTEVYYVVLHDGVAIFFFLFFSFFFFNVEHSNS